MELPVFKEKGFERRICNSCGSPFWTKNPDDNICGDTPCAEYTFIGKPPMNQEFELDSMRDKFMEFFKERDHKPIGSYPVVARWRDDVYLVNASIYDFQPHITSGEVPPPANPLVISQPCIRMVDLDSVGRSGRHLSNFEMMAHHAFNLPSRDVYWQEETTRYCMELLEVLGIPPESSTYKENPWVGGGNGGQALEVIVAGLELATLVFMDHREDPHGQVVIKGQHFSPMNIKIVDTGYGLERFVWCSKGTPTIYEAIYPEVVGKIFDMASVEPLSKTNPELWREWAKAAGVFNVDSGSSLAELRRELISRLQAKGVKMEMDEIVSVMEPVEAVYSIADHCRCLAIMLHDGLIPSNVKDGYLVRLVLRKALRHIEQIGLEMDLAEVLFMHADNMKGFAILDKQNDLIRKILALETERYKETTSRAGKLVEKNAKNLRAGGEKALNTLIKLYDTHGLHPSLVKKVAITRKIELEVPDGFDALVAEQHLGDKDRKRIEATGWALEIAGRVEEMAIPETKPIYLENEKIQDFEAVVLFSEDNVVILDRTAFYAESGGQPADHGVIITSHTSHKVTDVQKVGPVIMHKVEGEPIRVGEIVQGKINFELRKAHMRHHTATHLILGSAREVLGPHIWQAGAQKGAEMARLDVTHYERVSEEDRRRIELLANEMVLEAIQIEKSLMKREEAERKYGFKLYQGGPPAGRYIRVVRIGDFDVQGCGGTHCDNTSEVGPIKILKVDRIQDGVVRFEYSAGLAAVNSIQNMEILLETASNTLSVTAEQLPKAVDRFFKEWKSLRKEVEELRRKGVDVQSLLNSAEVIGENQLVSGVIPCSPKDLPKIANELTSDEGHIVVIGASEGGSGTIIVARSEDVDLDCVPIVKEAASVIGGSGGGQPNLARGGGPEVDKMVKAIARAIDLIRERIGK
jgi:alanyl-tRNA synthetase